MGKLDEIERQIELLRAEQLAEERKLRMEAEADSRRIARDLVDRLFKAKDQLGITDAELARRTQVSRQMVSLYKSGKNQPSLGMFIKLNDVIRYYDVKPMLKPGDVVSASH